MAADFERSRLVLAYYNALQVYSEAVKDLRNLTGPQFTEAYARAEDARGICEKCRLALEDYERNFGAP